MAQFTISLDPAAAKLYLQVAHAAGKPVEEVLADALFKLAGELSLEAPRSLQLPHHGAGAGRQALSL